MGGYASGGEIPPRSRPEFEGEFEEGPLEEMDERDEAEQMLGRRSADGLEYGTQLEEIQPVEGFETEQQTRTEAQRDGAFFDAIRNKQRFAGGPFVGAPKDTAKPDKSVMMAAGGEVETYDATPESELRALKLKKYGWKGR